MFLVFGLLAASAGTRAVCASEVCSCMYQGGRFLVSTGAVIPLDSRGIPWSGILWNRDGELELPDPTGFSIERIDASGRTGVGVELELVTGPLIGEERFSSHLILVKPRGGFVAKAQYVFTDYGAHTVVRRVYDEPRQVVITVSDRRLSGILSTVSASILASEQARAVLSVENGASCSILVDATQIALALELPAELSWWNDVLLFTTNVDGEVWRPRTSVCSEIAPGESWMGRGADLVFASCTDSLPRSSRPSFELSEGRHDVVMTAWWPGVDVSISASTQVELSCSNPSS